MSMPWWKRIFSGEEAPNIERPEGQRWGRVCPHCGAPSKIRSSRQITTAYAEQLRWCENPLCGHIWIDSVEALRTLSPSAIPNHEINIPLSPHVRREQVVAVMQQPEPRKPPEQMDLLGGDAK